MINISRSSRALAAFAGAILLAAVPLSLPAAELASPHSMEAMLPPDLSGLWGTINGLREELARQLAAKNLKSVHESAEQLTGALIKLREASNNLSADKFQRVQGAVTNLVKALDGVHDAADVANQLGAEKQFKAVEGLFKVLAAQYPSAVASAKPMQENHAGHGGPPGAPTVQVTFLPKEPLTANVGTPVTVRLRTKDGRLVSSADLELAHTKLVHLLIVDSSLTSYSHEHPIETAPGEWSFTFTPKQGGQYTIFADLLPKATGVQEYARTTAVVAGDARPLDTGSNLSSTVDGYRFDLRIPPEEPLAAGSASLIAVHVTKPDGTPATNLEPIMAAFAHGVGFTADLSGVLHVHPMGREPEGESERGGPDLSFHLQPASPGFFKFYVQVQIDGQSKFAGFGLNAAPARELGAEHDSSGAAITYVCPMHPEVKSTKVGDKCPKCGMTLVAKKSS